MLNDHFIQTEVEYLHQQRLRAAADHRRARSAARSRSVRARLAAVAGRLRHGRRSTKVVSGVWGSDTIRRSQASPRRPASAA